MNSELFDVVIYEIDSRKVVTIVGRGLTEKGFHSVDRRIETVNQRLNEAYDVVSVPAGFCKEGYILP